MKVLGFWSCPPHPYYWQIPTNMFQGMFIEKINFSVDHAGHWTETMEVLSRCEYPSSCQDLLHKTLTSHLFSCVGSFTADVSLTRRKGVIWVYVYSGDCCFYTYSPKRKCCFYENIRKYHLVMLILSWRFYVFWSTYEFEVRKSERTFLRGSEFLTCKMYSILCI